MNAEPVEPTFLAPLEITSPHAPGMTFRIGPTLTQIMGFGATNAVASWIRDALPTPAVLLTPDAYDEALAVAVASYDPRHEIEAKLDQLESRADWLERRINAIDNGEELSGPDTAAAAEAMALALEWEGATGLATSDSARTEDVALADPIPLVADPVVLAHAEVEAATVALNASKRSDRKGAQERLDAARNAEQSALTVAGASSYSAYLMTAQAQALPLASCATGIGEAPSYRNEGAQQLIALRARTAQVLGRLPGADPIAELRDHAKRCLTLLHTVPVEIDPAERDVLVAELDDIDAQGQVLADSLEGPFERSEPSTEFVLDVMFSSTCETLVIDGDLLWACPYDVREALLQRLRDVAVVQRVVLVSDETVLDAFVDSIPRGMLWSSGHLHLLHQDDAHWSDDPAVRGATIVSTNPVADNIGVCVNHAGSATRLACPTCHRPFCSLCLIIVDKRAIECVACALGRGGVRARRWRA